MKTAVGYVRTSGLINPKSSIPNQIKLIEEYCRVNDLFLKDIYVDEAKTGIKVNGRSQYILLKESLKGENEIDILLVAYVDRLGRESFEFIQMLEEIKRHNVELISISEGVSSKSMTPLQLVMMAVQAEMENKQRYERIFHSKELKLNQGKYLLHKNPPYGYKLDKGKHLIIDQEKAEVVKFIFKVYLESKKHSIQTIKELVEREFPNINISSGMITNILTTKTYTGYIYSKTNTNEFIQRSMVCHPIIITESEFNKCYDKYQNREIRKKGTSFYLLTRGIFHCPVCKEKIIAKELKYTCPKKCWRMDQEKLEERVIEAISSLSTHSQSVKNSIETKLLLDKKKVFENQFALGQITMEKLSEHLKAINQELTVRKNYQEGENWTLYLAIMKSGSYEQLRNILIKDKIKLTLDKDGEVIQLMENQ